MKYPKRCQYKHAKQKKYHVRNWAEYNEGLRRRGDLTVWFDEEAIANWKADKTGEPGGQRVVCPIVALQRRVRFSAPLARFCRGRWHQRRARRAERASFSVFVSNLDFRVPRLRQRGERGADRGCAAAEKKATREAQNRGRDYRGVAGQHVLVQVRPGPGSRSPPGSVASRCWTVFSLRVRGTRIADIASDTPQIWGSPRGASLEFVCIFGHDGMNFERLPLIVTDGFEFYQKVIRRFFGPACLYGQVLKTRRNDRIIKVERRALHGTAWRFDDALNNSEDSSTLNTSFIERLNLTIRQSSAYLSRRTLSHARSTERLDEHLELLRCYYNFVRPHGALKFGREIRTPAMQAGLTTRRLTFRDIFLATTIPLWLRIEVFLLSWARNPLSSAPVPLARSRVATLDGGSTTYPSSGSSLRE